MDQGLIKQIAEQFSAFDADAPVDMKSQLRAGEQLLTFSVGSCVIETIVKGSDLAMSHEDAAKRIFAPMWVRMQDRLGVK